MSFTPLRSVKATGALSVIPKSECPLCDHTDYQTACSDITQWTLIEGVRFLGNRKCGSAEVGLAAWSKGLDAS
jgi:hypothetical protein